VAVSVHWFVHLTNGYSEGSFCPKGRQGREEGEVCNGGWGCGGQTRLRHLLFFAFLASFADKSFLISILAILGGSGLRPRTLREWLKTIAGRARSHRRSGN
jgi:hypothetical protein